MESVDGGGLLLSSAGGVNQSLMTTTTRGGGPFENRYLEQAEIDQAQRLRMEQQQSGSQKQSPRRRWHQVKTTATKDMKQQVLQKAHQSEAVFNNTLAKQSQSTAKKKKKGALTKKSNNNNNFLAKRATIGTSSKNAASNQ